MMGSMKQTKFTLVNFSKKISFRGKWVINVQFGPNLKHLIYQDLPYSKDFFETLQHNGTHSQTIVLLINFPKKSPFQAKRQFGPNLAKNYSILYLMICQRLLLKHLSMMGHDRLRKVTLVSFLQKCSFSTIVQFGPNISQNYATLYPKQLFS